MYHPLSETKTFPKNEIQNLQPDKNASADPKPKQIAKTQKADLVAGKKLVKE